jgi:hypothetical protein
VHHRRLRNSEYINLDHTSQEKNKLLAKMRTINLTLFFSVLFLSIFKDAVASGPRRHNGITRPLPDDYNILHRKHGSRLELEPRNSPNLTYVLWATHSSGKIFTVNYVSYYDNGTGALEIAQELDNTEGPSFLLLDDYSPTTMLYCFDSSYQDTDGNTVNGSVTAYEIDPNTGLLTEGFSLETLPNPVSAVIYTPRFGPSDPDQNFYLAVAHQ